MAAVEPGVAAHDEMGESRLTLTGTGTNHKALPAQVAELVDAQVSGTCGRKVVEVRVFSWAPPVYDRIHDSGAR